MSRKRNIKKNILKKGSLNLLIYKKLFKINKTIKKDIFNFGRKFIEQPDRFYKKKMLKIFKKKCVYFIYTLFGIYPTYICIGNSFFF